MSDTLVSVIIPTFNSGCYLRETLASVFQQTYSPFEVIVVDDASTDETVDILRSFGSKLRVLERSANSHTADVPRYQGVKIADGEYCAFIDSDDLWEPEKLDKQVTFLSEHPDIPLCHTYVRVIDAEGCPMYVRHEGAIPMTGHCAAQLLEHCFISTSSVMVKRELWLKAQREDELTSFGTEWDFFLSIAREHPIGFIPEVLAYYRHTPGSVSSGRWRRTPRDIGAKKRIYRKGLWRGVISQSDMKSIIVNACEENADHWRSQFPARSLYFCLQGLTVQPWQGGLWMRLAKGLGRNILPSATNH